MDAFKLGTMPVHILSTRFDTEQKYQRLRQDSNLQSSAPEADALSIRPRKHVCCATSPPLQAEAAIPFFLFLLLIYYNIN